MIKNPHLTRINILSNSDVLVVPSRPVPRLSDLDGSQYHTIYLSGLLNNITQTMN